jgi:glycosyltransferase involved in cell wall biosynthesis
MIVIASRILGGPGKGLFQFIRHAPPDRFGYVLCNFDVGDKEEYEFARLARDNGLKLRLLKQRSKLDLSLFWQAYRIFRDEGCNIIQTHGYKGHIIGLVLSSLFGIKWVALVHGWTCEDWRIRLYNLLERWILNYPDLVVTVSPLLQRTLSVSRGKQLTELVMNAVDETELPGVEGGAAVRDRHGIDSSELLIGVFGRLSPEKGQKIYLDAFRAIREKHRKVRTLIVGDGQERNSLEETVREYGMDGEILFCGHQRMMRDYYEAIDLLVLPSLTEGLPNVVLEAMAFRRPVLATDVGGVREIIADGTTGWIVPAGDARTLADRLDEILSTPERLPQIGGAAREALFPKFSPKGRAERLLQLYGGLLRSA